MTTFQLILREIAHRKLNFLLSLAGIGMAVSLFVAFFTTGQAARRETTRLMRDLGFNLRIIPRETEMERFWAAGFSAHTMPESYVYSLASHQGLSYAHLSATLQQKVSWRDQDVILTGIAPEVAPPGRQKPPMGFAIEPGTVYVGFELARKSGLKRGDQIDISGRTFTISRCLSESGSEDDIRIYGHLRDVQNLLHLENKINEIKALQCLCIVDGVNVDSLAVLREQLTQVLPDAKVIMIQSIATARERQRVMAEKYFAFILPFVAVVSMVWIGVFALLNVRERAPEIGIMRALGYGSGRIALLFLGKAAMVGLSGAVLGFGVGTVLALEFGPEIFKVTAGTIKPTVSLLYWSLLAAPSFCALAAFIPATLAVAQDPALVLREE